MPLTGWTVKSHGCKLSSFMYILVEVVVSVSLVDQLLISLSIFFFSLLSFFLSVYVMAYLQYHVVLLVACNLLVLDTLFVIEKC